MKRSMKALLGILFLCLFITSTAYAADPHQGNAPWGKGTIYGKLFNPDTMEVVSGDVISVNRFIPQEGMEYGVQILVQTPKGKVPVHLGPGWFVENQELQVLPRDRVEILGSKISFNGEPAMIATKVKNSKGILELRDAEGQPVWGAQRGRNF